MLLGLGYPTVYCTDVQTTLQYTVRTESLIPACRPHCTCLYDSQSQIWQAREKCRFITEDHFSGHVDSHCCMRVCWEGGGEAEVVDASWWFAGSFVACV